MELQLTSSDFYYCTMIQSYVHFLIPTKLLPISTHATGSVLSYSNSNYGFINMYQLDSKCHPSQQFLSLFAVSCNIPAVLNLWDYYFVHGDPFLIFFLALVLVINAKYIFFTAF